MENEIKVISHNVPNKEKVKEILEKLIKKIEELHST